MAGGGGVRIAGHGAAPIGAGRGRGRGSGRREITGDSPPADRKCARMPASAGGKRVEMSELTGRAGRRKGRPMAKQAQIEGNETLGVVKLEPGERRKERSCTEDFPAEGGEGRSYGQREGRGRGAGRG